MSQIVGTLSSKVASVLGIQMTPNQPIYIGKSNIAHMLNRHPADYAKYGQYIQQILANPDYVGTNPQDGSIEYVKEFKLNNDFVKVAVRISGNNKLYVRSLYVLNKNRTHNFIGKGTLKKI